MQRGDSTQVGALRSGADGQQCVSSQLRKVAAVLAVRLAADTQDALPLGVTSRHLCERLTSLEDVERRLAELSVPRDEYAAERSIRDAYGARLAEFRPCERVWRTEHVYYPSLLRG